MSHEGSTKGSNSHSESSNSSSSQAILILQSDPKDCSETDLTDLTLTGMPATLITRTGTVRRASTTSRKDRELSITDDDDLEDVTLAAETNNNHNSKDRAERFRRSLDSTYRHSLESISEYKAKNSFSSVSLFPSVEYSSIDSSSSGCTDYAAKCTPSELAPKDDKEKPAMSPSSSYLSWIESVNSEYFSNTTGSVADGGVDSKVGEWNNFWLNYNSARSKYLSSPYLSVSNEDKTGDELSDARSTSSTQKEFNEKNSSENVILTVDEINEAIKCCQKIVDILQNALRKNDQDIMEDSRNDSSYSQPVSQQNSIKDDIIVHRERSFSYAVGQDIHKQKLMKPAPQSSSSSCINALLNTGVADILKRVISKRRDILGSDNPPTVLHRASFSDWSSTK